MLDPKGGEVKENESCCNSDKFICKFAITYQLIHKEREMSSKKACTIFSLILILAMLLSACGAQPPRPGRTAGTQRRRRRLLPPRVARRLICVIVPPVENPFFGAMQEIAASQG